jgi:outer membrane lipoprotein LolB
MMWLNRFVGGLWLAGLLSVAGCASVPPPTVQPAPPLAASVNVLPSVFAAEGRLAVNAAGKGHYGGFVWQHENQTDVLDIVSPLGSVVARLTRSPSSVVLENGHGRQEAADADTLTTRLLGYPLPLDPLAWWLSGLPAPDASWVARPEGGEQLGWQISFADWRDTPLGVRPHKISLVRADLTVRFVVQGWRAEYVPAPAAAE